MDEVFFQIKLNFKQILYLKKIEPLALRISFGMNRISQQASNKSKVTLQTSRCDEAFLKSDMHIQQRMHEQRFLLY